MTDVMVDLETLGQRPGCAILSIGARVFDAATGELGDSFYAVINTGSCRAMGLVEDASTVEWWSKRPEAAQAVLREAETATLSVTSGLLYFAAWLKDAGDPKRIRVWGNGADFDNAILSHLYGRIGEEAPWKFWNGRCYRTLKNLIRLPEPAREGVHHNALDDATHQAKHALRLLALLEGGQ